MTLNPRQSRQAQIASLLRRARTAEAHGNVVETISHLREVVQLDPHDRQTLHRLGDLFRIRLNRLGEAATWYARAARANERDELPARAIAMWRTVLQCDSVHVEAHERIGALYLQTGRLADARQHYERSERILREAGRGRDAAILRAEREALEETEAPAALAGAPTAIAGRVAPDGRPAPATPEPPTAADADALELVAERLSNGRAFHHFGLHTEARRQLEELLAMMPEHVEARQLLAEVCRTLGDDAAAAHHVDVLVQVMRRRGQADPASFEEPLDLPPMDEWQLEPGNPFADLVDDVRGDVERVIDRLFRKQGGRD